MATWTRQVQEKEGAYQFDGQLIVTAGINAEIPRSEITAIHQDILQFVKKDGNADTG